MTAWEDFVARTLLHSLWEGAAVALALSVVLRFLRNSRARYAASAVAMVALLSLVVVAFTHFVTKESVSVLVSNGGVERTGVTAIRNAAPSVSTPGGHGSEDAGRVVPVWIVPLWFAGVVILYLRGIIGWMAARRLRHVGVCCAGPEWQERMDRLGARLRLTRTVALLESCVAEIPVVMGYWRPVVLMPVGLLAGMPVAQVEAILLHELAHIRRYDYVVNLMQVFMEGLLFYHPAVWWISGVMRDERENCCDDVVVAVTGRGHEFAIALTALEERRAFGREVLAATGGGLSGRIRRLPGAPERRFAATMPVLTAGVLTLYLASATLAWQKPVPPPPAVPAPALIAPQADEPAAKESPSPAAPPAAPQIVLPDRKILPGDLLSITVFEEPELSKTVRVDANDGMIALPVIQKKLQAAGLMPRDVETEVSRELLDEQILLHPIVNVSIQEYAERNITVVGDVRIPRQFPISSPITVLEALAKAGWVTSDAAPELIVTLPDSNTPVKISIAQLLQNSGPSVNLTLTGGEVINVPDAQRALAARFPDGPKVWITGNIGQPQVYSIANPGDASVSKAVARVQSTTKYSKTAYLYRADGAGQRREIPIPLSDIMHGKAQDVTLQPDDVLLIPDDDTKKMQQYYDTHPLTPPWELSK